MTTALDEPLATTSRQIVVGWSAFSVDIETNPADGDRIFKIGAVRSDNHTVSSLSTGRLESADVGRRINAASTGARLLIGHNLRRHDVPQLRRQYPGLACLALPTLDTLELSAIAFPSNPYHRLVKGYKLVSNSRNDPVKDARLTLDLVAMRAEGGRNPYCVDLGTVEAVVDTLPRQRPEHRPDINLRYVAPGPADVDIGFAGRHGPSDPLHQRIARLSTLGPLIPSGYQACQTP